MRRIQAGPYEDYQDRLRCRLTDVQARPTHVHDLPSPSPDHLIGAMCRAADSVEVYLAPAMEHVQAIHRHF